MSLFRAGFLPKDMVVALPVWQDLKVQDSPMVQEPDLDFEDLGDASSLAMGLSPDPRREAEAALEEARLQAAEIVQKAAAEAEALRRHGFETGRQEGLAAGKAELEAQRQAAQLAVEKAQVEANSIRQQAEADARALRAEAEAERQRLLTEARDEATRLADEARKQRDSDLEASQDALVDLVVAAAVRLVQGHLAVEPKAVVAMVAAGLRRLRDSDCTVRISPEDLPLVTAQRSQLERELGEGSLQIQQDDSLNQGSYLIQSAHGSIDGTLPAKTRRLREAMGTALGRE